MANYTIISYDFRTGEWGWIGTQTDVPDSEFVDILDAPKDVPGIYFSDVVLQLPPTFLRGSRVKAKMMLSPRQEVWFWIKNAKGQLADDDYDGPVEPIKHERILRSKSDGDS